MFVGDLLSISGAQGTRNTLMKRESDRINPSLVCLGLVRGGSGDNRSISYRGSFLSNTVTGPMEMLI